MHNGLRHGHCISSRARLKRENSRRTSQPDNWIVDSTTPSLSNMYLGWCYKPAKVASIPLGISNFPGKYSAIVRPCGYSRRRTPSYLICSLIVKSSLPLGDVGVFAIKTSRGVVVLQIGGCDVGSFDTTTFATSLL